MITLLSALLTHTIKVLSFQHDGNGLPKSWGGLGGLTCVAVAAVCVARVVTDGADSTMVAHSALLLVLALAGAKTREPALASGVMLTETFIGPAKIMVTAADLPGADFILLGLAVWQLGALFKLHQNLSKSATPRK